MSLKKYLKKHILFSSNGRNSIQRYIKEAVKTKRNTVISELWTEDRDGSNKRKIPEWISDSEESKEIRHDADNTQFEDKEKETDESNSKAKKNDKYILHEKNNFAERFKNCTRCRSEYKFC